MGPVTDINKKYQYKYLIISFLVVFALLFMVLFIIEKEVRRSKIQEIKTNEQRVVNLQNDFLGKEFSMILADLNYLHHAYENQLENAINYNEIELKWLEFSTQRRIYDQIRFIDKNGDEKIRINFNENGGYIVSETELQNKKDRYYFYETVKLKKDVVHISPLDLNVEQDKIEEPYKPMIRFSTPLYDQNDNIEGIIVLNYLADYVLSSFKELAKNSQGEMMLLNSSSYWLSSEDENNNWNFMFEDEIENTFNKIYPHEWNAIKQDSGQKTTKNGLFTFKQVDLRRKIGFLNENENDQNIYLGDEKWYIVSQVKRDTEHAYYFNDNLFFLAIDVLNKNTLYFILIGIVSSFVSFLVYINRKTYTKIKYFSEFDPLTKLLNRRAGISKLNNIFPGDDRRNFLVSLCFIDINGLKQVNDTLGHKYGDELIETVANVIQLVIREQDFAMRLGGDEFLIVFNGIDTKTSEIVWERIVDKYTEINSKEDRPYIISVSHGIIDYDNKEKSKVDALINTADEKMYKEKQIIKANLDVIRHKK